MKSRVFWDIRGMLAILTALALMTARPIGALGEEPSSAASSQREPSAFAEADRVVVVGEEVEFFGYGSSADDEIAEYAWDFDSDGVQDFLSDHTGHTTHRFSVPGDFQCVLTVKDSVGRVAKDSRRITVVTEELDAAAQQILPRAKRYLATPPNGVRRRYAVMINGASERRFWRDVELGYDMLVNSYGFLASDIYVLNHNGTDPDGGNPDGMIDYAATYANLQTVFGELASAADADDEVFIWITGHGRGYSGPLSEGGRHLGYLDGRASVDPGDEQDFLESDFKLRSIFTGGDYGCNHGMNEWKVRRKYSTSTRTHFYRNMYVSKLRNVYIESSGGKVSDTDVYIERLVDYALGDTNRDGYIDTAAGEVFDFDADGNEPYNHSTGQFDEDDWGPIDVLEDDYNNINSQVPVGGHPYKLFDDKSRGRICIDLGYTGGELQVDGRDEDNAGLFDWMDVNQDADTLDIVSVDESIALYTGHLYDDDLAEFVDQLSVARVTIVAEPCFSGGLVEDISAPNRVICTAAIEDALSYGNVFIRGFAAALDKRDENGNPVDADTNANGFVSMLEAFNYAAAGDHNDEIPQYDDNGDGISHTDPVPAGGDGSVGCQTYLADFIVGDLDGDSDVDFDDYAILAAYWLRTDCAGCGGADWNCDERLDLLDLLDFAAGWLAGVK